MKRIILALAIAGLSSSTFALPPPGAGTPLNVNVANPVLTVETSKVSVGQVDSTFANRLFSAQKGSQLYVDSPNYAETVTVPTTVRMATFMPYSYSSPPSIDVAGFPCQGTYFVSLDGGSSWSRIAETMWSAPNFAVHDVVLPVPIEIPAGATMTYKLRLWMPDGPSTGGCRMRATLWVTQSPN